MEKKNEMQEKREAVNKFRYEMANELGFGFGFGASTGMSYGGAGYPGEYLIKRMIEAQERQMENQGK